jgi:hypothetical protein
MASNYIERTNMGGGMGQSPNQGVPGMKIPLSSAAQSLNPGGTITMGNGQGTNGTQNGAEETVATATTARDYRDDLRDLLDHAHTERGLTRYRLCKQMGIDSGTLSNVLAKRRHFSLEKLEQILGLLGYRLSFTPTEAGPQAM